MTKPKEAQGVTQFGLPNHINKGYEEASKQAVVDETPPNAARPFCTSYS